jgi:YD repeat-containing protein
MLYAQEWTGTSGSGLTLYRTLKSTYDYLGHVTSSLYADGTHTSTKTYDALGQVTSETDPDLRTFTYTYDLNGNLTSGVDARGAAGTIYMGYDALNRSLWK